MQSCATAGYDGLNLFAHVITQSNNDPKEDAEILKNLHGYNGAIGSIAFDDTGSLNLTHRMYRKTNGKLELIVDLPQKKEEK